MLWPVDPLPWVMDTATVLFVLNTGVYLAPSSLKYRCEIPSLTPLPVWSPCPSWFTGLEGRAVVPHVCVAEGCCLSRPLTHHLSSHLPEQPNPATVQGVPFAPGFSPRQVSCPVSAPAGMGKASCSAAAVCSQAVFDPGECPEQWAGLVPALLSTQGLCVPQGCCSP